MVTFDSMLTVACLAAVPILALCTLLCLAVLPGEQRPWLLPSAAVFGGTFLLFVGGGKVLELFGLAWRNLPSAVMSLLLFFSGGAVLLFTMGALLPAPLPKIPAVLRWLLKTAATASAALVLFYALALGGLLITMSFGDKERVIEYEGQTWVEVDRSFLDPCYDHYAYHGPLVRGSERLHRSMVPLDETP